MRWTEDTQIGFFLSLTLLGAFSAHAGSSPVVQKKKYAMGTVFEIVAYSPLPRRASAAIEAALQEVTRLDHIMSNYDPRSNLSRLNRSAHYRSVGVPHDLFLVIREALRYSALSGGRFDITVGPLVDAWKSVLQTGVPPSPAELDRLRQCVGYQKIRLIPPNRVNLLCDCAEIDLGAIGKGYAVDRAAQVLRSWGVQSALIDAGGSTIYGLGAPPGKPGWLVHLRDPSGRLSPQVLLRDSSVSTSEQTHPSILGDVPLGHIIELSTGSPARTSSAVSVVAETAVASDALSTTLLLMGPAEGQNLTANLPRVAALWISNTGEHRSASTGPRIVVQPSTESGP